MISVTFIAPDGTFRTVITEPGGSLMEAAIYDNVPGIDAECGGNRLCATCHVHVAEHWVVKIEPPITPELELLSEAPHLQKNSRLSCQIRLTTTLDGLVVAVPPSQH
jgi:2Fe-2S ferredoxin